MWRILLYINSYSVAVLLVALLAVCTSVFRGERRGRAPSRGARAALAVLVVLVLVATLTPHQAIGSSDYQVWLVPGQGILFDHAAMEGLERSMYVRQQIANLLMFVPLAVAFRFAYPTYGSWGPVAIGALLGLSIEAVQWVMAAGRVVDIDDVIVNSAGAALGALICLMGGRLARMDRRGRPEKQAPSHRRG
ncbi:VanZ family protein [Streptomyces sp. NPDC008121]|uniref:VanZ family protein n=1 Tax=Streptomyces sp. NPDC008121 TaxID=3364809 RepID=UPI0036E04974